MGRHLGGVIGVLAALAFVPLNCRPRSEPVRPAPPVPRGSLTIPTRPVRVLVLEGAAEARVAVEGPYEVRHTASGAVVDRGPALAEGVVVATANGFRIGARDCPGAPLDLVSSASGAVVVNGNRYRGALRFLPRPGRTFQIVNVLALEPYLAGVLSGEMPANWPAEALKAQAVAARTYALFQIERRSSDADYDLRADQWSQMYLGLAGETPRTRRLVEETAGIVLTYGGRLLCTYYSSTCGGHTQNSRYVFEVPPVPPLGGLPCPYCAGSKYFRWEQTLSMADLTRAVNARPGSGGQSVGEVTGLQVLERAPSGHVARIRVMGSAGAVEMRGVDFRHAVGTRALMSTRFEVQPAAGGLRFVGGGFGHGVGMCQVGARGAAEHGLDFLQILQYYYPHSSAVRLAAPGVVGAAATPPPHTESAPSARSFSDVLPPGLPVAVGRARLTGDA